MSRPRLPTQEQNWELLPPLPAPAPILTAWHVPWASLFCLFWIGMQHKIPLHFDSFWAFSHPFLLPDVSACLFGGPPPGHKSCCCREVFSLCGATGVFAGVLPQGANTAGALEFSVPLRASFLCFSPRHRLQSQRDNVAFYMCKQGDFVGAVQELFAFYPKRRCTACRLTPIQFETYLKMFRTGCVPSGRSLEDSCASWHRVGKWSWAQSSLLLAHDQACSVALVVCQELAWAGQTCSVT